MLWWGRKLEYVDLWGRAGRSQRPEGKEQNIVVDVTGGGHIGGGASGQSPALAPIISLKAKKADHFFCSEFKLILNAK